jgi:hypothetical protein
MGQVDLPGDIDIGEPAVGLQGLNDLPVVVV